MTAVKSQAKWLKIAPRKLGRVAKLLRGKLAAEALGMLALMPQKGARFLEKTVKSAVANAKNNYKLKEENLIVAEAFVNKGVTLKRMQPRAKGRAFPIQKRTSHLTVWVRSPEKTKEEA